MVNTNELKAELKRNNITQEELAGKIGMNPSTLNKKINNKQSVFTVEEANQIAIELNIQSEKLITIFFDKKLANTQETNEVVMYK